MIEMTKHQKEVVDVAKDVRGNELGPLKLIRYEVEVRDVGRKIPELGIEKHKPLVFIYAGSSGNVFVETTYFITIYTRGRVDWIKRFFGYKFEKKFYTRMFWFHYRRMKKAEQRGEFKSFST